MGLLSTLLEILGFGIGLPLGLLLGFFLFVYSKPDNVEEPEVTPIQELDTSALQELSPTLPHWIKSPDYERVDWLNKFIFVLWPYLDKGICAMIRSTVKPMFEEYIGSYQIQDIYFETLTLGSLPPVLHGMKVYETNESELVMEPSIKWAGNPNIVLVVKMLSVPIRVQLIDLQVFASPRIRLRPLVPAFPCFSNIMVSLIEKPHVDFGFKVLGGDIMSIPGLYRFIQRIIKKQIATLYFWPQSLQIPVLDSSLCLTKKPVGILHVRVVRALKLLKMDFLGASDPYVKLRLSGGKLPTKKTSIKMKTLNPEWNEDFKFIVNDPENQVLELQVYDWDKVGAHDRLGAQTVPLKPLIPYETNELTLDLRKNLDVNDDQGKRHRGELGLEVTYEPFRYESSESFKSNGESERIEKTYSKLDSIASNGSLGEAGALLVTVIGAGDVEGQSHTNPFAEIIFRGERRRTKVIKRNRNPRWNEQFEFMIEDVPLREKIHVEVKSKRRVFGLHRKESLGYAEISLADVVHNGRINEMYNLIESRNGVIHIELEWQTT